MPDIETTAEANSETDEVGGLGGERAHPEREFGETGLTARQDQQMTGLAIRRGWLGKRFDIDTKVSDLKKIPKADLTTRQNAIKTAATGCDSSDPRVRQRAVKNIIDMEKMNQVDEIQELVPMTPAPGVNININGGSDGGQQQPTGPRVVIYLPENGR